MPIIRYSTSRTTATGKLTSTVSDNSTRPAVSAAKIQIIVTIDFAVAFTTHILYLTLLIDAGVSLMALHVERLGIVVLVIGSTCSTVAAQPATADRQPLAEEVFKNVQVLKGIPVSEFMGTMGFFAASVGLNCVYCHVADSLQDWQKFADDVPRKRTARAMIQMVNNINKTNFGGSQVITCYSCHHGNERPPRVPSLALQYGTPEEDPNEIEIPPQPVSGPSADQILDKFINASGGAQHTSFVLKGTYEGYETYHEKVPFELYAKAPGQLTTVIHSQNGDSVTVFDGRQGWVATPNNPVPLLPLAPGAEVDGARLDAQLFFSAQIKQALNQWRAGFPVTTVGDADVQVIQAMGAGRTRVKLFFDQKTGLLSRQLRYSTTAVGINPIQIDYANYRDVGGVKLPFRWIVTWTNGQSIYEVSDAQPDVAIDQTRFAKPSPAVLAPAKALKQ
jgi:photosynthetic reaction center cytochrome c subunit